MMILRLGFYAHFNGNQMPLLTKIISKFPAKMIRSGNFSLIALIINHKQE